MKPEVNFSQDSKDPKQQVILFDPPVASWSFSEEHSLDELWKQLRQASHHLLFTNQERDFDEEIQQALKARILLVLLFWETHYGLKIPTKQ